MYRINDALRHNTLILPKRDKIIHFLSITSLAYATNSLPSLKDHNSINIGIKNLSNIYN